MSFPGRTHLARRMSSMTVPPSLRAAVLALVVGVVLTSAAGAAQITATRPSRSSARQLSLVFKPAHKVSNAVLAETVRILRHRLNSLGLPKASARSQRGEVVVLVPDTKKAKQFSETIGETGRVFLRPALCGAPAFAGEASPGAEPATVALPACTATSQLTESNLGASPSAGTTFHVNTVPADRSLAAYPSTSPTSDRKARTVLLPAIKGAQYARYLLGPAAMTDHAFASATAQKTPFGRWLVNYTLTSMGTSQWEDLAKARFHEIVAVDLDGVIQSAPLIEPSQSTFVSFAGRGEIAGNLTEDDAQGLALAMQFGPLPVRLIHEATRALRASATT